MSELPPALAIMGPTASGKTRLAIELAHAFDGEVISVDSGMVYVGMDIGTAKPSPAEREGVPHHLIDILDPAEPFSAGQFRDRTLELMAAITARGRLPILAGGTMLYYNALLHGLSELPAADPAIRRQIDAEAARVGWDALHRQLAAIDPAAAARIHPNDPQRIQRALEVFRVSGLPLSAHWQAGPEPALPFRVQRIVLVVEPRAVLHARIAERFDLMLQQGLLDEVRALYERGDLDPAMPSIRAVGYRQAWAHLAGETGLDDMRVQAIAATRQFAKRQLTWLRRERDAAHYTASEPATVAAVVEDVRQWFAHGRDIAGRLDFRP